MPGDVLLSSLRGQSDVNGDKQVQGKPHVAAHTMSHTSVEEQHRMYVQFAVGCRLDVCGDNHGRYHF